MVMHCHNMKKTWEETAWSSTRLILAIIRLSNKVQGESLWQNARKWNHCSNQSPWSSPVTLVPKRDGTERFCVDFWRLSEVTRKASYPLPRINDIFKWSQVVLYTGFEKWILAGGSQPCRPREDSIYNWKWIVAIHSNAIWTVQCISNHWMTDGNSSMWIDWQDMPRLFRWCGYLQVDRRWTLTATLHCVWEAKMSWIKAVTQEVPVVPEGSPLSWIPDFRIRTHYRFREDKCHCYLASTKECTWGWELSRTFLLLLVVCQRVCPDNKTLESAYGGLDNFPVDQRVPATIWRSQEELQEYDFQIQHCKGTSHWNADELSQRPSNLDCKQCQRMKKNDVLVQQLMLAQSTEWRCEQLDDNDTGSILRAKEQDVQTGWADLSDQSRKLMIL